MEELDLQLVTALKEQSILKELIKQLVFLVSQNVFLVIITQKHVLFVMDQEPHHQIAQNHHQRLNPKE
jgi:hypothetical protein